MHIVMAAFAIVMSLLLVVGLHEAGHAFVARLFKVKIHKISIGFGPILLRRQIHGCQWVWAFWPLGGYVQLLNSRIEPVQPKDYPFCFDKKPLFARCLILISGVFVNVLVAWLALILFWMIGHQEITPVIANVTPNSMAAKAGLTAHDKLLSVAGKPVSSWQTVGMQLLMSMGQSAVEIAVKHPNNIVQHVSLDLSVLTFKHHRDSFVSRLGIQPDLAPINRHVVAPLDGLVACQKSFTQMLALFWFFGVMLKLLLTGVIPFTLLLGPLGLFTLMVNSFLQGLAVFLYFLANLSIVVALINCLPIPGLDGGSLLYAGIEKIRGKPISVAMEVLLHRLMFIVLCLVLVQLLLNDVKRFYLT